MSKALHARKIVETNADKTPKELIDLFVAELGMNRVMARTYLYNARKSIASPAPVKMAAKKVKASN